MTLDLPASHPFAQALVMGGRAIETVCALPHGQVIRVKVDIPTGAIEVHEELAPQLAYDRLPLLSVADEQAARQADWAKYEQELGNWRERPQS